MKGFYSMDDGSAILTAADGTCPTIDFSNASGADAMLVMTGPGAPEDGAVDADGREFSFLFLGGRQPTLKLDEAKVIAGGQTVSHDGKKITLGP